MLNEAVQYDRETREQNRYRGMNPAFYEAAIRKAKERAAREQRERIAEEQRAKLEAERQALEVKERILREEREAASRFTARHGFDAEFLRKMNHREEPSSPVSGRQSLPPKPITIERIMKIACRVFKIRKVELLSARREKNLVLARQFVMYWARRRTTHSLPVIGRRLGNRDHTTVIHGSRLYSMKRAEMGRRLRSFGEPRRQFKLSGASR